MGKKGRSKRLIERRNQKIVQRYYFWTEVKRLRFDDAVKQLAENEFFLSEFMIWQILKKAAASNTSEVFKETRKHKMPHISEAQLRLFPTDDVER